MRTKSKVKIVLMVSIVILLLAFTAGVSLATQSKTIMVYFLDRDTAEPVAEVRSASMDINPIMRELLKGPDDNARLYSVFPQDTRLLGFRCEGRVLILYFDQSLENALRTGKTNDIMLEQVLRLTLSQLKDLDSFRVTAGGKDIGAPGGHINFDTPLELAPPMLNEDDVGILSDPAPHLYAIIDPGHGGNDPGAYNWEVSGSILEKDVVLDIGTKLYNYIDGRSSATAYMTRSSDMRKELSERVSYANSLYNQGTGNIYVSIHANSQADANGNQLHTAQGIETYYKKSIDNGLASHIHSKAKDAYFGPTLQYFQDRGVKYADFYVLRETLMPAALVEAGFISNTSHDYIVLSNASYRQEIAYRIYLGIRYYWWRY